MARIQGQVSEHSKLAITALSWITHARTPLRVSELLTALAVRPEDHSLDKEALPEINLVLSVTAGLTMVESSSKEVRLVHLTVEQYFRSTGKVLLPDADKLIAATCLTFLSFDVFSHTYTVDEDKWDIYSWFEDQKFENPMFDYAASNWTYHIRGSAEHAIEQQALDFLSKARNSSYLVVKLRREMGVYVEFNCGNDLKQLAAHFMIAHGLKHLLMAFIRQSDVLLAPKPRGAVFTPMLHVAAMLDEPDVLNCLLEETGAYIDGTDRNGRTPLIYAAASGSENTTRILLSRNANINLADDEGRTPLYYAVWPDIGLLGRTRLPFAVSQTPGRIHFGVMKLLLECENVVADSFWSYAIVGSGLRWPRTHSSTTH